MIFVTSKRRGPIHRLALVLSAGASDGTRTDVPCEADGECHVHRCSYQCVVRRIGGVVDTTCKCSNDHSRACRTDAECNANITCSPETRPAVLRRYSACHAVQGVLMENHAGSDPGNLVSLCQVQALTVQAPHAVSHSAAWGRHLLLFASDVDSPSPLFKANDGAGFFTLAAYVPVHRAESALLFRVPGVLGTGIVVTQREEPEALFLRWNGTGVETCAKLPMSGSRTAAHIRGGDRDLLLLGGSREGLDGESQMYQTLVDILPEMDGPEALAVSPDGQHVYVLAPNSHAILCFKREQENGSLSLQTSLWTRRVPCNLEVALHMATAAILCALLLVLSFRPMEHPFTPRAYLTTRFTIGSAMKPLANSRTRVRF
jgi:hypothetical protein